MSSSSPTVFHRLPPDLLPVIFAYLTPHDCFQVLPLLCTSFPPLPLLPLLSAYLTPPDCSQPPPPLRTSSPPLSPTVFKSPPLVITVPLLHRLAASAHLRSVLALTPHLSFDLRGDDPDSRATELSP